MNKIKRYGIISGIILIIAVSLTSFMFSHRNHRTAFVKMEDLYSDFSMKQQLEKKLKETEQARKFVIDSMRIQMQQMTDQLKRLPTIDTATLRIYNLRQDYFEQKQQEFAQDNNALAQQYTEQIWTQINQYTRDYGKENGFNYIFGASGDGVLMYADDSEDITADLKIYINEKYQGKAK